MNKSFSSELVKPIYGHVWYHFDEVFQYEDWAIEYNENPVNAHFNIDELQEFTKVCKQNKKSSIWLSIKGVTGDIKITFITKKEYDSRVESNEIIEDYWPHFGVNKYISYNEICRNISSGLDTNSGPIADSSSE